MIFCFFRPLLLESYGWYLSYLIITDKCCSVRFFLLKEAIAVINFVKYINVLKNTRYRQQINF